MTTRCAQCKKVFQQRTPQHRFCGIECSKLWHRYDRMKKRDQKWEMINGKYPTRDVEKEIQA
jgi:hypothetical protein